MSPPNLLYTKMRMLMPTEEVSEQVVWRLISLPHLHSLHGSVANAPPPPMLCSCMYIWCLFLPLQQALLSLHKLRQQVTSQCVHLSLRLHHVSREVDLRVCVHASMRACVRGWVGACMHVCVTKQPVHVLISD